MKLQLPSNKYIERDGISFVDPITLYEYPDVYVQIWYDFDILYKDGTKLTLSYDTKSQAEYDRDFILRNIHESIKKP